MTLNSGKNESRRILNLTEMPASKTRGIEQRTITIETGIAEIDTKKEKKNSLGQVRSLKRHRKLSDSCKGWINFTSPTANIDNNQQL